MCYLSYEGLAHAVDLEVIKQRTNVSSEDVNIHSDFHAQLLQRDICCVWTGAAPEVGSAMHIIPFQQGSEVYLTFFLH